MQGLLQILMVEVGPIVARRQLVIESKTIPKNPLNRRFLTLKKRRHQADQVKRMARISPDGRGVLLAGLWACRMTAGLSQRELAEAIGTNPATIQALETTSRGAYPKTIKRLCRALAVEPVDLICNEPNKKKDLAQ